MFSFIKKSDDRRVDHEPIVSPFAEWAMGQQFFSSTLEPWKRTINLLVEIQKRALAEQVVLICWDKKRSVIRPWVTVPSGSSCLFKEDILKTLIAQGVRNREPVSLADFAKNKGIVDEARRRGIKNFVLAPVSIKDPWYEGLLIINHLGWVDGSQFHDFLMLVSSVLALFLQNVRLFSELRKKNRELKQWAGHVEDRIEEGTKRLLEKEFQYFILFEGLDVGIVVHDLTGKILECNRVASEMFDMDRAEFRSANWNLLLSSGGRRDHEEHFLKVAEREAVPPLETILRRKNGSIFWAELSSRRLRFRGKEGIQTVVRDTTARKNLENHLRESEEKYRLLVESSLIGVFIIRSGIIQYANSMMEEMLGYRKGELLNRNFLDFLVGEHRSALMSRENRREAGEELPDRCEVRMIRKDNRIAWTEIRTCRILLDGKNAVLGHAINITHRKETELQLIENQKMESIGTLAGGIAHDFNNLLGGILGYASLLLGEMNSNHPFYEDIHSIAETAKRAADLTNRLLAFARRGKYRVVPISLNQIVEDIVAVLSRVIPPSVVFETTLETGLWTLQGDSHQLHQVILNIGMNAVEAMPDGGQLSIMTSNIVVDADTAKSHTGMSPGEYVKLVLSDTGFGMDEKTKIHIFEPFFTTKPVTEGAGLGLAVVYGIVKNHDGFISIESALGRGTEIVLLFPRFTPVQEQPKETPREKPSGNTILLVDDEKVILEVGRRMLEKGGFEVLVASNGLEALKQYEKFRQTIALVLLDLSMPGMSGKETFRRLREINPDVLIGFTSGYGPEDRPDVLIQGSRYFIQKPFHTEMLLKKVREMVKSRHRYSPIPVGNPQ